MSVEAKPVRWDAGDPYCDHGPFVQWYGHLYCAECAMWMGPTMQSYHMARPRPLERWRSVQMTFEGDLVGLDVGPPVA